MTPENQQKQTNKTNRYLVPGILLGCVLLGILWLRSLTARPTSAVSPGPQPTLQINLPSVEYPTVPASAPSFTVRLESADSSGITGTATFQDIAGTVALLLHVDGAQEEEESEERIMPAELRHGTCAALGPVAYPMSAPDAGESETDLSINLRELNTQRPMAVVLYRSTQDRSVIACGDLP